MVSLDARQLEAKISGPYRTTVRTGAIRVQRAQAEYRQLLMVLRLGIPARRTTPEPSYLGKTYSHRQGARKNQRDIPGTKRELLTTL